ALAMSTPRPVVFIRLLLSLVCRLVGRCRASMALTLRLRLPLALANLGSRREEIHVDRALRADDGCELLHACEPPGRILGAHAVFLAIEVVDVGANAERPLRTVGSGRKIDHGALDPLRAMILALAAADREDPLAGEGHRLFGLDRGGQLHRRHLEVERALRR